MISSVLGLSATLVTAPACVRDAISDDDGGNHTDTTDPTTPTTGDPSASGSSSGSADGESSDPSWPYTTGPDCGADVSKTVCVPMPGSSTSDTGETGGSDDTGATTAEDGSTSGDPGGSTTTGGGSCEGADPTDYSFCVYFYSEVYEMNGQCCRDLEGTENCCDGRPFYVDGTARKADVVDRTDWSCGPRPCTDDLSSIEREALAAAWSVDAQMEHASVASFARFALQLLAVGAPPELLEEAQRAMADEVRHAQICFSLASAYAGRAMGPGPLPIDGALDESTDVASILVATIVEACIGETIAAMHAEVAASRSRDPAVRRALEGIAADEARHALLAWRFVGWMLERDPSLCDVARRAFATCSPGPEVDRDPPVASAIWEGHGRLGPRTASTLSRRAFAQVIRPCAEALLGRHRPGAETGAEGARDRRRSTVRPAARLGGG